MTNSNGIINYEDILSYGEVKDNMLYINQSFNLECERRGPAMCALVSAICSYSGKDAPHICFYLTVKGQSEPLYKSHIYRMGDDGEYKQQAWKVPPMFLPGMKMTIEVNIPEKTVLKLMDFSVGYSMQKTDWNGGLRHNSHLGFWDMAPDNTMPAFELAAMCGYSSCIVVPKVTADGEIVCIHDDTINRTARDENGNEPKEEMYVWDFTYDELLKWEYGSWKNEIYKGAKIPRLEDFFILCAKTGMRPMFSTHPGLTVPQWQQVKAMLEKYGLLKNFHIKSFYVDVLKTAYSVFGTEIDGYTYDVNIFDGDSMVNMFDAGVNIKNCRAGIEVRFDNCTEEVVKQIKDAGMFAAVWDVKQRTSEEYMRLISWGVTEFTEDNHCSMGLNW